MNLLLLSKNSRIVLGCVVLAVGYLPVLFNNCIDEIERNFVCMDLTSTNIAVESATHSSMLECQDVLDEMVVNGIQCALFSDEFKDLFSGKRKLCGVVTTVSQGAYAGYKIAKGEILSNFYVDARQLGVPAQVVDKVVSTLSPKINFKRSLRSGSKFEVVYNDAKQMVYAKITTNRKSAAVYRVKNGSNVSYCFEDGTKVASSSSAGGTQFGQPLQGRLKVSSAFGMRLHPIQKQYKFHAGVDFAAKKGSPVFAICDGVVIRASYFQGYGKCVDIQHAAGYVSRYAHLNKILVSVGARVKKQTQIGEVGSTGKSTGAHLHLELARNNKRVNPLSVKMIPAVKETVKDNGAFYAIKRDIRKLVATSN